MLVRLIFKNVNWFWMVYCEDSFLINDPCWHFEIRLHAQIFWIFYFWLVYMWVFIWWNSKKFLAENIRVWKLKVHFKFIWKCHVGTFFMLNASYIYVSAIKKHCNIAILQCRLQYCNIVENSAILQYCKM